MDFRDNWLAHFKAIVDQEISDAHGDVVAGRTEVARKVEMGEPTIYQYYAQKSKKPFPSVDLMVLIEKKYGAGRPPGWSAQAPPSGVVSLPQRPKADVAATLSEIGARLAALPPEGRAKAVELFSDFAKSPDSEIRINEILSLLGEIQDESAIAIPGTRAQG